MPIYVYRCAACGHADEHMQKIADAALTECPACHADGYQKQVTAAGFQLKGTGWYATDFKGGAAATSAPAASSSTPACPGGGCACH
ncbi:hypothetical protein IGB42_01304 [Andreprevotia sp. IGB-42]|nr:hypothetical protein IGB42_01304 [Andreprevotia sp. IGB-42]